MLSPTHFSQHESRTLKVEQEAVKRLTFGLFEKNWYRDNGFVNSFVGLCKTIVLTFSKHGKKYSINIFRFRSQCWSNDYLVDLQIVQDYRLTLTFLIKVAINLSYIVTGLKELDVLQNTECQSVIAKKDFNTVRHINTYIRYFIVATCSHLIESS